MFISDWWGGENWRRMEDWMFNLLYDIWKWMLNGKKIFKFLYSKHILVLFAVSRRWSKEFSGDEARIFAETKRGVLRRWSEEFRGDKARSLVETERGVLRRRSKDFHGDEGRSFVEMKRWVSRRISARGSGCCSLLFCADRLDSHCTFFCILLNISLVIINKYIVIKSVFLCI